MFLGCACHLIHLAAEKGAATLPYSVEDQLISIYYYLDKSSKRQKQLVALQKLHDTAVRKILKHVSTRWLSLGVCLQRLLSQWLVLTEFFKEESKSSSTRGKSSSSMTEKQATGKASSSSTTEKQATGKAKDGAVRKAERIYDNMKSR